MTTATLGEALAASAQTGKGITYLEGDGQEVQLCYEELYQRALRVLGELQAKGLQPRAEVVFQLDGNQQLVDTFWACQLGGFIAIPLNVGGTDEHQLKTLNVLQQLKHPVLVSQGRNPERLWEFARRYEMYDEFAEVFDKTINLTHLTPAGPMGSPHKSEASDIASLQYSSGSTGTPKGVVLTHENLMADIDGIVQRNGITASDSHLSWVPLTHDLGMVMFHLLPIVVGADQYLMPANRFARRPLAWLQAASDTGATVLCSPNFGYHHYLKSFLKAPAPLLDLSRVRIIFNGGEPIAKQVCEQFSTTLAPVGLSPNAIRPAYGLAEACVAVTMTHPDTPVQSVAIHRGRLEIGHAVEYVAEHDQEANRVVCVGEPVQACEVQVVDERDNPLPEDAYGHVRATGPMVSPGYYGSLLQSTSHHWLDTGDLGFMHQGNLYIVGRAKDAIIINGVNYHPNDLERVCQATGELEAGKVTCCGVFDEEAGQELLLIFVVHRQGVEEFLPIAKQLRRAIGEQTQLEVTHVLPIRSMPKTTSGKVQRYKLVNAFTQGEYKEVIDALSQASEVLSADTQYSELEKSLHGLFNTVVPDERLRRDDNYIDAGISSLSLAEISEAIDAQYPDMLELGDYLEHQTIAELAAFLEAKLATG